jgi:hypothetical protein
MRKFTERFRWPQVARQMSALLRQYVPNLANQSVTEVGVHDQ